MKIFALDPGPKETAYVIWDGKTLLEKGKVPNVTVLSLIGIHSRECRMVCEMIASYGMAVGAEVFETCIWIGRFVEAAQGQMDRVVRLKMKQHLCHSPKANDSNIRQALIDRLGAPGTKAAPGVTYGVSKDVWAALAVAVTYYDNLNSAAGSTLSSIVFKLP